eukprot:CAMPEP_0173446462 /NCGR_PEP_ID=MMETSP1357-20121228/36627_1 /TAXON_ID=77926 /ORGANISM="Hemiselmis rufescens, Strain PCC563" /LENGTH=56 /DNA_ID=CAMNT_0014412749 /DNA_START=219 /DNA_END=386 /DNA_ORIENTATION=+
MTLDIGFGRSAVGGGESAPDNEDEDGAILHEALLMPGEEDEVVDSYVVVSTEAPFT